jgi:hypothetical protein
VFDKLTEISRALLRIAVKTIWSLGFPFPLEEKEE